MVGLCTCFYSSVLLDGVFRKREMKRILTTCSLVEGDGSVIVMKCVGFGWLLMVLMMMMMLGSDLCERWIGFVALVVFCP